MTSLVAFLADAELKADAALAAHLNGAPGFYMASAASDAEYFAVRRPGGGNVLTVDIDDEVVDELVLLGATRQSIPGIPPPYFAGDEFYIPLDVFMLFNARIKEGRIHVFH
jgi:hypothetical protein